MWVKGGKKKGALQASEIPRDEKKIGEIGQVIARYPAQNNRRLISSTFFYLIGSLIDTLIGRQTGELFSKSRLN